MSMIRALIEDLKVDAAFEVYHEDEDFVITERASNYDDAYEMGMEAGRALLARELLATLEAGS